MKKESFVILFLLYGVTDRKEPIGIRKDEIAVIPSYGMTDPVRFPCSSVQTKRIHKSGLLNPLSGYQRLADTVLRQTQGSIWILLPKGEPVRGRDYWLEGTRENRIPSFLH